MRRLTPPQQAKLLARVRKICLAFPDTSERASHGESAFFVKRRSFANTDAYHHGAEHYSLWVAAPLGAQDLLLRGDADHYFRPPYVGGRGWVGVTLDNAPDWDAVERIVADGHAAVAAKRRAARG